MCIHRPFENLDKNYKLLHLIILVKFKIFLETPFNF